MGHPDFRVSGKIFATLWKGNGVVLLRPEQQAVLVKSHPETFSPVKGRMGTEGFDDGSSGRRRRVDSQGSHDDGMVEQDGSSR